LLLSKVNAFYIYCFYFALNEFYAGREVEPFVNPLLERLIPILTSGDRSIPMSLLENAAIVIGRLGLVCSELVAPHLELFSEQW
jgi:transportin-1